MQLTINPDPLLRYAQQHFGSPIGLQSLQITDLAQGVYRLDLTLRCATGQVETLAFVHKSTYRRREIRALQALTALADTLALPRLIDAAIDPLAPHDLDNAKATHWFVTPFYPGATLNFGDALPSAIMEALAQVHVYFAPQVENFADLERIDGAFFRRTCDNALAILGKALGEKPHPILEEAARVVTAARDNQQLYKALAALPVTLTHGDVHPGNILVMADDQATLIDWGNVCLAPPMFDLANMVTYGSPNWMRYLATWEKLSGTPLDGALARLGYDWATVMINLFYLPYAVDFLPLENVQGMVNRLHQAEQRLNASA